MASTEDLPRFTAEDVAALKSAIATGASKVRFADSREVTYRTLNEMERTLARAEAEVSGRGRPTRFVAGYRSGLA